MTDKEMAERFANNISGLEITCNLLASKDKNHAYRLGRYDGFIAGLEAGRQKRHDLRKNPEDLPEIRHPVCAKLDSGTYVFAYCVDGIWHRNDGIILHHGDGECEVIAWCEI